MSTVHFPTDPEAELGALGCVIERAGEGWHRLTADMFATTPGEELFKAMEGLAGASAPICSETAARSSNTLIVGEALEKTGPGLDYWLPILRDKRALRATQRLYVDIALKVGVLELERRPVAEDIRVLVSDASVKLAGITLGLAEHQRRTMKENLGDLVDQLAASDRGEKPPTVPTGLPGIDWVLGGGLRASEMAVLGARTSVGKSALAVSITRAACNAGKSVLYASRELRVGAIMERLVSAEAGVAVRVADGSKGMSDQQRRAIPVAAGRMKGWHLDIRDDLRTIAGVRAEASTLKPDLVVIDHVGIFDANLGPRASTYDKATHNSNACRDLAFETGAAVLVLAQVNRAGAEEDAPRLDHLKSTGALEEDARVVLLLHRVAEIDRATERLELNLAKNTSGELRLATLRFDKPRMRFAEEHGSPDPGAR